jgi:phenylpyruvate tautomerase PptA (4-oxalocrotonate tautomerase family)
MPLYTVSTQTGVLTDETRAALAESLTAFHCDYSGVARSWVHVIFQEYSPGRGYSAGSAAPAAALTLLIRTGRSVEYKRGLMKRLWEFLQSATRAPDDQIVIGIQEGPPSQAMEMGQLMPEV